MALWVNKHAENCGLKLPVNVPGGGCTTTVGQVYNESLKQQLSLSVEVISTGNSGMLLNECTVSAACWSEPS